MAMVKVQKGYQESFLKANSALIFILLLFLVSFSIKFWIASNRMGLMDYDEYYTMRIAFGTFQEGMENDSFEHIIQNALVDNGNNFLYNLSVIFICKIFGFQEMNIRLFSIILHFFSLIIALKIFIKNNVPNSMIIIGLFVFTFHPILHTFSTITRAYSMLTFESLLFYYLFYESKQRGRKFLFFTTLLILAMFLTHYLSIILVFAVFIDKLWTGNKPRFLDAEVFPFWLSAVIVGSFILFNIDYFLSIIDKSNKIQGSAEQALTAMNSTRKLTLFGFWERLFEFITTWMIGSGYLGKLASGIWHSYGLLLYSFLNTILIIFFFYKERLTLGRSFFVLFCVCISSAVVMVLSSQHLTGFGLKYSIGFISIFVVFVIIRFGSRGLLINYFLALLIFNLLINQVMSVVQWKESRITLAVNQRKVQFSQQDLWQLRDILTDVYKRDGSLFYRNKEERDFLATLMVEESRGLKLVHSEKQSTISLNPPK